MKYKHIFFDLDRTLWDFDKSAMEAFQEIYLQFGLQAKGVVSAEKFHDVYAKHNERLWDLYRKGEITRKTLQEKRFRVALEEFGIDDVDLAEKVGAEYIRISPLKVNLFPQAMAVLRYLAPRYKLHIITNGFKEVQTIKLNVSRMGSYFHTVTTSEEVGVKKPDVRIFKYALEKAGAKAADSLMVGDDPDVDILGARNAGMDQVLFDPQVQYITSRQATYYIVCLDEMKSFL